MIRQNILDHIVRSERAAKTAIVLTHNIDFLFAQSVLLNRLAKVGHPALTIFADAGCAAATFNLQKEFASALGHRYRVVPVDLGQYRRFHPKAIFLSGDDGARLAVGSGNLTQGGYSANGEIWSSFEYPGNGGPEIAAFRDYLETVLGLVTDAETLRDPVLGCFGEGWAADLPAPGGLVGSPHTEPILDRMLQRAGTGVVSTDVVAPYFDRHGGAARELRQRVGTPVRVFLQSGREGLSQPAAAALPDDVALVSYEPRQDGKRVPFVHAKFFMFRKESAATVAVGSANCSRAALVWGEEQGNAELMALADVPMAEADALFEAFRILAAAPVLPDDLPADEHTGEQPVLRILAARREEERLEVHFRCSAELPDLRLETDAGDILFPEQRSGNESAAFRLSQNVAWVCLRAVCSDGAAIVSSPGWLDEEDALRASGPTRRIKGKLRDLGEKDDLSSKAYLDILELFEMHVRSPSAHPGSRKDGRERTRSGPYSYDDVFQSEFGKSTSVVPDPDSGWRGGGSFWDVLLSFFQFAHERRQDPPSGEGDDAENPKKPPERESDQEKERNAQRVLKVLGRVEKALQKESFVDGRSPRQLGNDIGFMALFLLRALNDKLLTREAFDVWTERLWALLFFGSDGTGGVVLRKLDVLPEEEQEAFKNETRSSRLSAAMTAWALGMWREDGQSGHRRIAAAELASRHDWMTDGGSEAEMSEAFDEIEQHVIPQSRDMLVEVWLAWIRAARAFAKLRVELRHRKVADLARHCERKGLKKGDLVWQGDFYVIRKDVARDAKFIWVDLLGGREDGSKRFLSGSVVPVREVIHLGIGLPETAVETLAALLGEEHSPDSASASGGGATRDGATRVEPAAATDRALAV